jgi:hypothetical protein
MINFKPDKFGRYDPLGKSRLLVHTDIGNEPDDQQSVVRLLTYANEIDIEGLVTCTSMWQRNILRRDLIEQIIQAYSGEPRENLMNHTGDYYPTKEELYAILKNGSSEYGMAGVGPDKDTEGSEWTIKMIDKKDPRPIWVTLWGGANVLAQALWKVRETRSKEKLDEFINKIRVYCHVDQDHASHWIKDNFSNLFYINTPFDIPHKELGSDFFRAAFENHRKATWAGISGELWYKFKGGPDSSLINKQWLKNNIQKNHGPLGNAYPNTRFAMETDTQTFLWLIQTGLRSTQSPTFGGWGGRYELSQPEREKRLIFTDSWDTVMVGNAPGEIKGDIPGIYHSNQATIWRWREAYQHDLAARMDWATTPYYNEANHPPKVVVKGELDREVKGDDIIELDATQSIDPDGDEIKFHWFYYKEAGTYRGKVKIKMPFASKTNISFENPSEAGLVHVILEVKDTGEPCLHRYARFIFLVKGVN